MRFLRKFQTIELKDEAAAALVAEARLFLESGLSLAEWESLDEGEQSAVVAASRSLATDRMAQFVSLLRAQTREDLASAVAPLDGGSALTKTLLEGATAAAAQSMDRPGFSRGVDA